MGDFNTSAVGQNSISTSYSFGTNSYTEDFKKKTSDENLAAKLAANSVWAAAAAAYMN